MSSGDFGRNSTAESELLDLLLAALEDRQAARSGARAAPAANALKILPSVPIEHSSTESMPDSQQRRRVTRATAPGPGDPGWELPPRLPMINLDRALARFALAALVLIVLINIPLSAHGVSLARYLPDSSALIIRDGLVLKGSGDEVYILQQDRLRWISSLDALQHLGLTWDDVHVVEDSFLERFEPGRPIYVLLKCYDSEHIYRLENGQKRWIKDIATFESEGHVWSDVKMVDCAYLRSLPDGLPIPESAGLPPSP